MIPPKPAPRPDKVSLLRYLRLFRADILSAQPARLYHAWMAEFRTPFFRSYLCNDPALVRLVLNERPDDFPKSDRVGEGLRPLLGSSVFVTNGEVWKRQRRIIDPAFEGGRLRDTFPAMPRCRARLPWRGWARACRRSRGSCQPCRRRCDLPHSVLDPDRGPDRHGRSSPQFRAYQRSQPILNLAAFLPIPRWVPRFHRGADAGHGAGDPRADHPADRGSGGARSRRAPRPMTWRPRS